MRSGLKSRRLRGCGLNHLALTESPAPIRNRVMVRPILASRTITEPIGWAAGTKVLMSIAITKPRMK